MKAPNLAEPLPILGFGGKTIHFKALEQICLNKRQLRQLTDFYGPTNLLNIGELTKEQLQTHVYYLLKERNKTENALYRAQFLINNVLP